MLAFPGRCAPVQGYYERMLKGGDVTSGLPTSKVLQRIVVSGIPAGQQAPLYVNLFMNGELEYTSKVRLSLSFPRFCCCGGRWFLYVRTPRSF